MEYLDIFTIYEVYLLVLRTLITVTVLSSCVVSISRLLNVCKFVYYNIKSKIFKSPENYFAFKTLPEDVADKCFSDPFPHVAVQVCLIKTEFCHPCVVCTRSSSNTYDRRLPSNAQCNALGSGAKMQAERVH